MTQSLFIAVMLLAGFALVVAMNAHGKARAFRSGERKPASRRAPEAVTSVELPTPQFNQRDPDHKRGKLS